LKFFVSKDIFFDEWDFVGTPGEKEKLQLLSKLSIFHKNFELRDFFISTNILKYQSTKI